MKAFSTFRNTRRIKHSLGIFLIPYGLIYLADGILTYMFPLQMQAKLENVYSIGFIIGFAAVGSILADFFLPTFFKRIHWNVIMRLGAGMSVSFPILTFIGLRYEMVPLLFIGSFLSGVYFEFISYSLSQFLVTVKTVKKIERDWSIVSVANSFFDLSAVLIGNLLLLLSILNSVLFVLPLQVIALLFLMSVYRKNKFGHEEEKLLLFSKENQFATKKIVAFFGEISVFFRLMSKHSLVILLFTAVWVFDALLWTYGGIWSAQKYGLSYAWIILAIYQLCSVLSQGLLIRFPIIKQMHLFSAGSLTLANSLFLSLFYIQNMYLFSVIFFVGTFFHSINFPIIETLLTNIAKKDTSISDDMIGLKRLVYSVAFIFAPVVGGLIGESAGFSFMFGFFNISYIVIFGLISLFHVKNDAAKKKISVVKLFLFVR